MQISFFRSIADNARRTNNSVLHDEKYSYRMRLDQKFSFLPTRSRYACEHSPFWDANQDIRILKACSVKSKTRSGTRNSIWNLFAFGAAGICSIFSYGSGRVWRTTALVETSATSSLQAIAFYARAIFSAPLSISNVTPSSFAALFLHQERIIVTFIHLFRRMQKNQIIIVDRCSSAVPRLYSVDPFFAFSRNGVYENIDTYYRQARAQEGWVWEFKPPPIAFSCILIH